MEDSKKLADLGVDGILLSNHGGRQLDRAPVPFHLLPEVVREVGKDTEVMVDTGIMNGADVVASLALGAKFTLIAPTYTDSWRVAAAVWIARLRSSRKRCAAQCACYRSVALRNSNPSM